VSSLPRTLLAYTAGPELADDYFARKIPVGLGILNAVLNEAGFQWRIEREKGGSSGDDCTADKREPGTW